MEQLLEFKFTANEANLILGALGKLPAEVSMSLILGIQQQAKPQLSGEVEETQEAAE